MPTNGTFRNHNGTIFPDRAAGGRALAEALADDTGKDVLVLGIPRGGVPVAAEVARRLDADLDVIVARKLGAPYQPELAIGAVTANGGLFLDHEMVTDMRIGETYLQTVIDRESNEAHRREKRFRGDRPAPRINGRTVIVVDDGLATGATMRAAVRSIRKHHPKRLVVAVPVGSEEACSSLLDEADDVVRLETPQPFFAVGLYYRDFLPTEDSEVQRILATFHGQHTASGTAAPA